LTTFPQPRHIPTQGYNITQSSAPDDGHMVARNKLSNYWKRNKEYKKWHLDGFLIHTDSVAVLRTYFSGSSVELSYIRILNYY